MKKFLCSRGISKRFSCVCTQVGRTPYKIAIQAPLSPTVLQFHPLVSTSDITELIPHLKFSGSKKEEGGM